MLSPKEKIDAITWKCEQVGSTYGKFVNRCSESDMRRIYLEYENLLSQRKLREQEWITKSASGRGKNEG